MSSSKAQTQCQESLKKVLLSALVFALLSALNWRKISDYSIGGDDYSLIEASRFFSIGDWFFKGFSDYFIVFEGSENYTNFIRPIVNLVFWANNQLFSDNIGFYFFSSILFISLYCHQLLILSGRNLYASILIPIFCIASPSIALDSLGSPPFAFDVLAAVFILSAINSYSRKRFSIALLLLFLSVFTKEIGLAACIGFAAWCLIDIYIFHTRKPMNTFLQAFGFITPVITYGLIRLSGTSVGGTYAMNNFNALTLIKRAILFPLRFPLGVEGHYNFKPLVELYRYLSSGQIFTFAINSASIVVNIFSFFCVIALITTTFRSTQTAFIKYSANESSLVDYRRNSLLLVVLVISSIYLMIVGANGRFYPVPQACILVIFLTSFNLKIISKRAFRLAFISLLAVYSFLFTLYARAAIAFNPSTVNGVLSAIVKKADQNQMHRVLLINGPKIYSSPSYISRYYDYNGELDFLFNSAGNTQCDDVVLQSLVNDKNFFYRIKINSSNDDLSNAADCKNNIRFNGHQNNALIQKHGLSEDIIEVAGNHFYLQKTGKNDEKKDSILYIDIGKEYDGIFIADYLNGSADLIELSSSTEN